LGKKIAQSPLYDRLAAHPVVDEVSADEMARGVIEAIERQKKFGE